MGASVSHKVWEQSQCTLKNRNRSLGRTGEREKRKNPLPELGAHPKDRAYAWLQAVCRCSPRAGPEGSTSVFPIRFLLSFPSIGFAPRSQACIPQLPAVVARASATPVIRVYANACRSLRPAAGAAAVSSHDGRISRHGLGDLYSFLPKFPERLECDRLYICFVRWWLARVFLLGGSCRSRFWLVLCFRLVLGLSLLCQAAASGSRLLATSLSDPEVPPGIFIRPARTTICSALVPHTRLPQMLLPVSAAVHARLCTWSYEA